MQSYRVTHIDQLESEAIYVLRETAAQFENPALLFSGGKDSIVMAHLAWKAFYPSKLPFPLVHVDTGHNFPETMTYRDAFVERINARLVVGLVQDSIDQGKVKVRIRPDGQQELTADRHTSRLRSRENKYDACLGGGAVVMKKKPAPKERFFSHRDDFGQWDPKNQRPELWNTFNARKRVGEHFRVFPLSNWTEMDIWQYIKAEGIDLPSLYFSHEREVGESATVHCSRLRRSSFSSGG